MLGLPVTPGAQAARWCRAARRDPCQARYDRLDAVSRDRGVSRPSRPRGTGLARWRHGLEAFSVRRHGPACGPRLMPASPARRCWLAVGHGQVDLGAPWARTRPDADGRPAPARRAVPGDRGRTAGSSRSRPPVCVWPPSLHLRCTPPDPSYPAEIPHDGGCEADAPDGDRGSSRRTSGLATRPELPASTTAHESRVATMRRCTRFLVGPRPVQPSPCLTTSFTSRFHAA